MFGAMLPTSSVCVEGPFLILTLDVIFPSTGSTSTSSVGCAAGVVGSTGVTSAETDVDVEVEVDVDVEVEVDVDVLVDVSVEVDAGTDPVVDTRSLLMYPYVFASTTILYQVLPAESLDDEITSTTSFFITLAMISPLELGDDLTYAPSTTTVAFALSAYALTGLLKNKMPSAKAHNAVNIITLIFFIASSCPSRKYGLRNAMPRL